MRGSVNDVRPPAPQPVLLGVGTALPPHRVGQAQAAEFLVRALDAEPGPARIVRAAFRRAGVATRWSCVPDFGSGDGSGDGGAGHGTLLGARSPGTTARMEAFRRHAPPLAAEACVRALAVAGVQPGEVTQLVVVTCTGFFAPGPDVELLRLLGLRADTERTIVGFMGCHGAFNGLRVARASVAADPAAVALVVCVELCSLHFRPDPAPDNVIAHALFGDGAAAAVVARSHPGRPALARLGRAASRVEPGTAGHMTWEIGDDGFRMRLSGLLPQILAANVAGFAAPLAAGGVESWCVHPGGPAILDHVEEALDLVPEALASSREVLHDVGNVSSATALFVLERELARMRVGERGVMLGFGPGLTMEGLAFARGERAAPAPAPATPEPARVETVA